MRNLVFCVLLFVTLDVRAQRMVTAEQIREIPFGSVWSACASVDENVLFIASDEGRYVLYDLRRRVLTGHRIPRNVELTAVAVGSEGEWYVGDAEGALWTSEDRGLAWNRTAIDTSKIVKVLQSDGSVVIVSRSGGVYTRHSDGTVQVLRTFPGVTLFDADEREGRLTVVGSRGFLATATSGGLVWQERQTSDSFAYTSVLRVSGDTLVVGGMKGTLLVSHNNGDSWVYRTELVRYLGVDTGQYDRQDQTYDLAMDKDGRIVVGHYYTSLSTGSGQGPCRYVMSIDRGKSWDVGRLEEESSDGAFWDGVPLAVTHTHKDGSVVVLGSTAALGAGAIYRQQSTDERPRLDTIVVTLAERDSSLPWPTLAIGEQRTMAVSGPSLYSMNRASVYGVLSYVDLRKSQDTGRTWVNIARMSNSTVAITATDEAVYAAESPCIVRRSTDDGASWTSMFELQDQLEYTRVFRVGSTLRGAVFLHYGFAYYDTVRARHSANAIVIHKGVGKDLPVPTSLDSITITEVSAGLSNDLWYVVTGYRSGDPIRVSFVCHYDLDVNTSQSWFIPRSSEAGETVPRISLIRGDRLLLSRTVDTIVNDRPTTAGRLHWLRMIDGSVDEIAELRVLLDGWSMQTLDVMDFGPILAFAFTSNIVEYNLFSGLVTPVKIRGSSTTGLGRNFYRAPVLIGEQYLMFGENQRVISIRASESTTSEQTEVVGSLHGFNLYPNPAARSSIVSITSSPSVVLQEVRDLFGKLVLTTTNPSFPTAELLSGVYIVRIVTDRDVRIETLVVL